MVSEALARLLFQVNKPGRYVGGEEGAVAPSQKLTVPLRYRLVLSYPDLYELGVENGGIQLLYERFNQIFDVLCERVFCPDRDLEEKLLIQDWPLWTLESQQPVRSAQFLGFSLTTELDFTNILTILKTAQIPLLAQERGNQDMFIFAGGPAAFNPEPLADFIDFFYLGEAEASLPQLLDGLAERALLTRADRLRWLAQQPGVYVPSLYVFEFEGLQIKATHYLGNGNVLAGDCSFASFFGFLVGLGFNCFNGGAAQFGW